MEGMLVGLNEGSSLYFVDNSTYQIALNGTKHVPARVWICDVSVVRLLSKPATFSRKFLHVYDKILIIYYVWEDKKFNKFYRATPPSLHQLADVILQGNMTLLERIYNKVAKKRTLSKTKRQKTFLDLCTKKTTKDQRFPPNVVHDLSSR